MKTLTEQVEKIQSAVLDIYYKTACGKTYTELIAEITEKVLKENYPFDFS